MVQLVVLLPLVRLVCTRVLGVQLCPCHSLACCRVRLHVAAYMSDSFCLVLHHPQCQCGCCCSGVPGHRTKQDGLTVGVYAHEMGCTYGVQVFA